MKPQTQTPLGHAAPIRRRRPLQVVNSSVEEITLQAERLERHSEVEPMVLRRVRSLMRNGVNASQTPGARQRLRRLLEMMAGFGLLALVGGWIRQWMVAS